jgi:hypothetical protein
MSKKLYFLVMALCLAPVTSLIAQSQPAAIPTGTQVGGAFVNIPGAPVKIASLNETERDLFSEIQIENTSTKSVSNVQFAWIYAAPAGCSTQAYSGDSGISGMRRVDLGPQRTASVTGLGVDPVSLSRDASKLNVAYVHFQIALNKVEFADGSVWTNPAATGAYFAPQQAEAAGKAYCLNGKLKHKSNGTLHEDSASLSDPSFAPPTDGN